MMLQQLTKNSTPKQPSPRKGATLNTTTNMKTATLTQLKLRAHICQTCLPCFAEAVIEDIEEFHPEITEPEQVDALLEWESYWEVYKDVHNISPRWTSYKDKTAKEWVAAVDELQKQL